MVQFHATTICAVRRGPDDVCIGGDGQVTMGESAIMKNGQKSKEDLQEYSGIRLCRFCSRCFFSYGKV